MSSRRFYICYFCNFTVCEQYFLLPREIIEDECPVCESRNWYQGLPVFKEESDCCMYFCSSCGGKLCHWSIESIAKVCPWCSLYDRWVVLPLGA